MQPIHYDGRYTVNGTFNMKGINRMGKSRSSAGYLHGIFQEHGMYMKKISSETLSSVLSHLTFKASTL